MPISAAELIARVSVQGVEKAQSQLLGMGAATDNLGLKLAALAGGAAIAGLVAVGVVATRAAGNYQAAVTRLFTTAGEQKSALGMVGSGVLDMSTQVGTGAQKLIDAMYFVESAGAHGKTALDDLRIAAMGAKTENSNLIPVVKTLMSSLNAYAGTGITASSAMNTLIAAVSQGHMTLNDLAGALANVLPASAKFHISMIDTTGAIAEMTKQGDNASSAATHLRQMILAFEAPSKIGAASMKLVGLSSQQLADEMKKSLPGAVQMVTDAVGRKFPEGSDKYNQAIKNIAGGSRSMMGFLELSGTHAKDFAEIVAKMAGQVQAGGKSIMGWADVQGNFNFKLDQAKAAVEAVAIKLGTALLPFLSQILDKVTPLITNFGNWETKTHGVERALGLLGTVLSNIGSVIGKVATGIGQIIGFFQAGSVPAQAIAVALGMIAGALAAVAIGAFVAAIPALVVGFIAWAAAAGAAAVATIAATWPLLLIGAAVALVIAGIILAVQHWGAISAWIGGVMSALGTKVHEILGNIGSAFSAMGSKVHEVLSGIGSFVGSVFSAIGTTIHDKLTGAKNTTGNVFSAIGTTIHDKLTDAKNFVGNAFSAIGTSFTWLYNHNKYISMLCDAIVLEFKMAIAWLVSAWTNTISWLVGKWNGLLGVAGAVFSAIGTFIHDRLVWIQNTVGAIFSAIGTFINDKLTWIKTQVGNAFSALGSIIHDKLTGAKNDAGAIFSALGSLVQGKVNDLKNAVGNAFSALGSLMHDKLVQAWNSLVSFASGWPSQAFQWGVNLIQGLISGIGNMLGALGNMLGNVAGQIAGALGFHHGSLIPPKEGPAKDADQWMPALMHGLVWGIEQGTPGVHTALDKLMRPLATQARASLTLQATGSLGAASGGLSTPGISASYALRSASGGQTINVHVHVEQPAIQVDSHRFAGALMPGIVSQIRGGTGAHF